jgi:hypothetical protein
MYVCVEIKYNIQMVLEMYNFIIFESLLIIECNKNYFLDFPTFLFFLKQKWQSLGKNLLLLYNKI